MRTPVATWWMVSAVALAAGALLAGAPPSELPNAEVKDEAVQGPTVALLAGVPGERKTQLLLATPGSYAKPSVVATFEHAREAVVRGAVLPDSSAVVVVADWLEVRDRSWASALLRLEPNAPPRVLVDQVAGSSRPLVLDADHVVVQRGFAGPEPTPQKGAVRLREDDVRIDEIHTQTGAVRTLHSWQGYGAFLAGLLDREVILYRVGASGADLVGVDCDTLAVRTIVGSWPAMARDFSVDPASRTLVLQQWTDSPSRAFTVERLSLDSGVRTVLATSHSADMVPYAWPGGGTYYYPEGASAPRVLGTTPAPQVPADPGVLWVRSQSKDGAWVGALRMHPRALPSAWVLRTTDGRSLQIAVPEHSRVEILGFPGGAP